MKEIRITDITVRRATEGGTLGFKERTETAKALDRLGIDAMELAPLGDSRADVIFVKTLTSVIHRTILALPVGLTEASLARAWDAVRAADRARLIVEAPVSSVQMEYIARRKPDAMLQAVAAQVKAAKALCGDVEFCADDASRAEHDFLVQAIRAAIAAGASGISVCDTAGVLLPDEFGAFVKRLREEIPELARVPLTAVCDNSLAMGEASAVRALQEGAAGIKTCAVGGSLPQLRTLCGIISRKGDELGIATNVRTTELDRTLRHIGRIASTEACSAVTSSGQDDSVSYEASDSIEAVSEGVRALGYELSEDEMAKVYDEFRRLAARKPVSRRELDVIVAASAMQVPAAYVLDSYVINSGNIITATASVRVTCADRTLDGISAGDGPIDAAFKAMECVTGRRCELEDFRIDAVTEGKEAIGRAIVHLRSAGRLYSGSGVSTDIVGAAIRAYLGALNKIVYEEKEA